ncbi:MAG: hypothetical protein ACYDBY_10160 [Thermoanaerobaculia bacterium]
MKSCIFTKYTISRLAPLGSISEVSAGIEKLVTELLRMARG